MIAMKPYRPPFSADRRRRRRRRAALIADGHLDGFGPEAEELAYECGPDGTARGPAIRRVSRASLSVVGKQAGDMLRFVPWPPREDDDEIAVPPLPPDASAGKRKRFRRNLVIYVAHRSGFSHRFLADVFGFPRSYIGRIIEEIGKYEGRG